MRRVSLLFVVLSGLLLVAGCQAPDLTRFWKLNRGDDYMNNDQYFSIPAQTPPAPAILEADTPQ